MANEDKENPSEENELPKDAEQQRTISSNPVFTTNNKTVVLKFLCYKPGVYFVGW